MSNGQSKKSDLFPLLAFVVVIASGLALLSWFEQPSLSKVESIAESSNPLLDVTGWLNVDQPVTADTLQGKVVLVDFWASWCGPCRQKMPELVLLHRQYHEQGLTVLGLTPEDGSELSRVSQYVDATSGMDWPIGYGANPVIEALGIRVFPTLILFDHMGAPIWQGHHLDGVENVLVTALARAG